MSSPHADGTTCLEGTRSVPPDWTPCCDEFPGHVDTCAYDIRYEFWPRRNEWFIAIAETAGGGGIRIGWCPHCGTKLAG
jgi:hypothetical protein